MTTRAPPALKNEKLLMIQGSLMITHRLLGGNWEILCLAQDARRGRKRLASHAKERAGEKLPHYCVKVTTQTFVILWKSIWFLLFHIIRTWNASAKTIVSSVRSSNSHPNLLVTQHHPHFFRSHRSSTLDFRFVSHYKAIMLYKGNRWTHLLATCISYGYNRTSL